MQIMRAYKVELDPNNAQRTQFMQHARAARYVYNWALADRMALYQATHQSGNQYEQNKRFNALKHDLCPWVTQTAYCVTGSAFANLDAAYTNFFRRTKQGGAPGFPRFKKRGRCVESFTMRGCIHVEPNRIKLPVIGWVRLKESDYAPPEETLKLLSVNVSEKAGRWFASTQVEMDIPDPEPGIAPTIGVDLGSRVLATCSDGTVFENPRALVAGEHKLKRLSREMARRKKGGCNRKKTQRKLARCHAHIANIRKHALHQVSHHVTAKTKPVAVVIEDLNVRGMMSDHHLAKAIGDASLSELRRQIEYKAAWNGVRILTASQWYPSTQLCSGCGERVQKGRGERVHACPHCGLVLDRDVNAALNLASLAL